MDIRNSWRRTAGGCLWRTAAFAVFLAPFDVRWLAISALCAAGSVACGLAEQCAAERRALGGFARLAEVERSLRRHHRAP